MSNYNFFNKLDVIKFFKATSDVNLQKAILDEVDKLESLEEKQHFISKVKNAGIDLKNLTSKELYSERYKQNEKSYEDAEMEMIKFVNMYDEEEDKISKMNPYQKDLYENNKSEYELSNIINEAFDYDEEDNKMTKSYKYYQMQQMFENKINEYNKKQDEILKQTRREIELNKDENDDNITIDYLLKNFD